MLRSTPALVATTLSLVLTACAKPPPVHVATPSGPWVSLFDGKDLEGWTVKIAGHPAGDNVGNTFRAENGVLKVSYDGYPSFAGQFGSLFYNKKLSHYWFRAEYRFTGQLAPGAPAWAYQNSGVQLHSQAPESMRTAQEFPVSVEFDLVGGGFLGRHATGDVCENGARVTIAGAVLKKKCSKVSGVAVPGEEWVTVLAEVQGGTRVRQVVNGVLAVDYGTLVLDSSDADARKMIPPTGDASLTSGYISLQSNGHPIEFRRLEILPLD